MALTVLRRLSDGTVVLVDPADQTQFVLRADQNERLQRLPSEQQREHAERFVLSNRRDTSGDRSQADEQAMDFARDSSSGEAHQSEEENR